MPLDDVPAFSEVMDIGVLPVSNSFGSPIALFEFMAMGKPCVVPDLGPMRDVLEDNLTGIMFPHADYESLEKALIRLVEDRALRIQIGAQAKRTVHERHTWAANAQLVVQLAAGQASANPFAPIKQLNCDTQSIERET